MKDHDGTSELANLKNIAVRLVQDCEREEFKGILDERHYLGSCRLVGERLCYVATHNQKWIALLSWAAASLKVTCRDHWVGWDDLAKRTRLNLVANNVRFLVLQSTPNLASKILSLNLKRLSDDWQSRYGHPILLVETFVDPTRFKGSCYLANGWLPAGQTRGFTRTKKAYEYNGVAKLVFVKELKKGARDRLASHYYCSKKNPGMEVFMTDTGTLPVEGKGGLIDCIKQISDPRSRRGIRHRVFTVLALVVCAMLSGARSIEAIVDWIDSLTDEEYQKFRPRRIKERPSESTVRRIIRFVNADEFDQKINAWLRQVLDLEDKQIVVDGKTVRGSFDGDKKAIQLLSALIAEDQTVIAQRKIADKTNEIPELKNLLRPIDIAGNIVSADALHTQKDTAEFIVKEKGADYFFTVKENQPTLLKELEGLDWRSFSP
jgi:hypothetical protein